MSDKTDKILIQFSSEFRNFAYKKGEVIIRGDDEPAGVYLLKNGVVKMSYVDKNGREFIVNLFKPGAYFPMNWALADQQNIHTFQAFTPVNVVKIQKEKFLDFLNKYPEVLLELSKRLLIGLDGITFNMRHMVNGDSNQKTALIVYMLGKRFGKINSDAIEIQLPITHQEIANFVGLARETVTISINNLINMNLISQKNRKLTILNIKELEKHI